MADILEFPGRGAFSPEGRVATKENTARCDNCRRGLGSGYRQYSTQATPGGDAVLKRFCTDCGAYVDALAIGAGADALFLYEGSAGAVTNWGSVRLGTVVNKTMPPRRSFQPVRFKVRMLDGSMWYGTGPSSCGNYIRLRRMKGH